MAKKVDDDSDPIGIYWRSRAMHLYNFSNRLTGFLLSYISTFRMHNQSLRRDMSSSEKKKETIVLTIAIILSVSMGSSMLGRLYIMNNPPNIFDVNIHSGFWEMIPEYESRSKVFSIENPTEYPLILGMKTLNFVPISSSLSTKVTWDYNGEPLLPDEAVDIKITLDNFYQGYCLFVCLDIHILGFISDEG